jgi:hypothetical protein
VRRLTKSELWWIAGLLEGEGCFTIQDRMKKWASLRIEMQTADRDVLERVVEFTGLGKVNGPYKTRAAHHSPMYGWHLYGRTAIAFVAKVYPLLCDRRRARIEEIFSQLDLEMPVR